MIRLDNIARVFGDRPLFRGLSWTIPRLARLGLVGPNGAGKTTLLRILTGAELPDEGRVERSPALRVGYLPQEVETVAEGTVLQVVLAGNTELADLERNIEQLVQRMGSCGPQDPEAGELASRYGELRGRFEALGGDLQESRAKAILGGLGVPVESFERDIQTLSGGWRMRVVLARLLLDAPDLLLLDEPTNHLDLEAIDWLERFLGDYAGAFVVVSHDRYFLNRMVRGVIELRFGELTAYPGNYDAYLESGEKRREALEQQAKQQRREIAKVERFIERFRYKNTKARQVQSRIRALQKVDRVRVERRSRTIRFGFPEAPRSGEVVFRLEGVGKRFGERVVYDSLDLILRRGTRLALVGPNGAGKTTLLRLLAGALEPDVGRVEPGHNVRSHYYAQHQLEALDPRRSVLEEIEQTTPPGERPRLRKLLGCFLFSGEEVTKSVAVLSGGEKARLALAKILIQPANVLLLDEPTNHLDLQSREVLEDALNEYDGTLVLVSHDRYFINRVATSVGEVHRAGVDLYSGDYDEFLAGRQAPPEPMPHPADSTGPTGRDLRREERRRDAEERNRRYRERRLVEQRLAPIERRIAELERRLGEIEGLQADPGVYRDPQRAADAGREKLDVERALAAAYADWERLAAELEAT